MSYYGQEANRWRRNGYADGKAGKPAIYSNQHYQRGWREGQRRREVLIERANKTARFVSLYDPILDPDDYMSGYDYDPESRTYTQQEKSMPRSTAAPRKLFVAVVFAERKDYGIGGNPQFDSLKPGAMGGWESFIAPTQAEAADKALKAMEKWRVSPVDGAKYVVLVGELTSKVKLRGAYDLVTLNA